MSGIGRWRALLGLLQRAGRGRLAALGAVVLAVGLLPTAVILLSGAFVRALPAAVQHGLGSAPGRPALLALGGLLLALGLLAAGAAVMAQLARVLNNELVLEVHHTVAGVALGTPGLELLDDPAFADGAQAVQDAEQRGVLRMATSALANVAATRLRGVGAFVVLLGFRWWAPLVLAAAWQLTNEVYRRATAAGVTVQMSDGAGRLRRAEYLRSLALDAPAAKEVRVFGLGGWVVGQYGDAWLQALQTLWRGRRANRALTAAAALALAAAHALVLGALGWAAARGEVGAAALLVFAQAVIATTDLGMMGDWQWFLSQALGVAERVETLRSQLSPARPGGATARADGTDGADGVDESARAASSHAPDGADAAAPTDAAEGSAGRAEGRTASRRGVAVRLEGVRFTYRGRSTPVLEGLDLVIPAGQSLAIVGENGAGKSTLIKLLCGFYPPTAGRITLDGARSPVEARDRVAVIFQDFVRYRLPLRENVAFGHLPLMGDDGALERVLRDAGGADLLSRLPAGWDTVLSREFEGGAELSGGQWQRVALARALAAVRGGAGLLILDEPTAALDVRAETELFDRFLELTRDVTTILVSHRLSSVRHADRIVVVEGGRVVEDGTHAGLVRAGGRYARMYALQAERFAAEPPAGEEEAHA